MRKRGESRITHKLLFGMGILYVIVAPALSFMIDNPKEPAVFFLISGVLLTVLSRFDDVSELGLFGLKAKIEHALRDAYATLEQVKEFAKISAMSSLSNTARSSWWSGIPDQQTREMLKSTQEVLRKLGCSEQEIVEISKDFHDCQLLDYRQVLIAGGESKIPNSKDQACQKEWLELRDRPESPAVHPDELKHFLEKHNFMTEENKKRLEGYAYYYKYNEFQDFEDFKNRRKWPRLRA